MGLSIIFKIIFYKRQIYKDFEAYAAPLLHLYGLDVQMIFLNTNEEIEKLAEELDPATTDGILVVGDDYLLQKVSFLFYLKNIQTVSSLLNRPEFWVCFILYLIKIINRRLI